jgi:hypothetical protein
VRGPPVARHTEDIRALVELATNVAAEKSSATAISHVFSAVLITKVIVPDCNIVESNGF